MVSRSSFLVSAACDGVDSTCTSIIGYCNRIFSAYNIIPAACNRINFAYNRIIRSYMCLFSPYIRIKKAYNRIILSYMCLVRPYIGIFRTYISLLRPYIPMILDLHGPKKPYNRTTLCCFPDLYTYKLEQRRVQPLHFFAFPKTAIDKLLNPLILGLSRRTGTVRHLHCLC